MGKAVMWGVQIIVATPGRMNDFLELKSPPVLPAGLSECKMLVLDEADRMLDMGFEPQIKTIIAQLPEDHQTMMFTATWPKGVQKMASEYIRNKSWGKGGGKGKSSKGKGG